MTKNRKQTSQASIKKTYTKRTEVNQWHLWSLLLNALSRWWKFDEIFQQNFHRTFPPKISTAYFSTASCSCVLIGSNCNLRATDPVHSSALPGVGGALVSSLNNKPMWKPNRRRELHTSKPRGTWTFNSGTFMWNLVEPKPLTVWNLVEPELLTVEPLCGTLWNLNF